MTFKKLMVAALILSYLCMMALTIYGYLTMAGCGSYTQLFDPNREPPEPIPEIIAPIKDDSLPTTRKEYYAQQSARDRYHSHSSWYRYTGYYYQPYETERYIYIDSRATPQPTQVAPITVQPTPPYNAEKAAQVWQKRTNPRNRQAPKPTKKGE
jgi:hypothetical protein|tara:strand:+ start:942 stop:1403 length:462 start_codon:yes stop_codon:yes gene_type:complete